MKDLYEYDLVKQCSKCKCIRLKSNFYNCKRYRDGLKSQCKVCIINYSKKYREKNPDYFKSMV